MAEKAVSDFTTKVTNLVFEDTAILVITDTVLPFVSFSSRTFSKPTRVIYKNLTRVAGPVSLDQVINLIEVSFPLLEKVEGTIFLHANASLSVNAPALKTIYNYLYVEGNTALTELKICNLSSILPSGTMFIPYYFISNNNSLDNEAACIKKRM